VTVDHLYGTNVKAISNLASGGKAALFQSFDGTAGMLLSLRDQRSVVLRGPMGGLI
jgi:hypothetical protein